MEWTVVAVIIALVGLMVSVLTPAIRLNTSVTKLSTLVDNLNAGFDAMENRNSEAHRRLWNELEGQKSTVSGHETRITLLEKHG